MRQRNTPHHASTAARGARALALALVAACGVSTALAQTPDPRLWSELRWRCIGPHRGGRTVAAVGVPGQPDVFYVGVNNGGVWKSDDYGRTWRPIFDDQPTGSIGALAVAPDDPRVIYVGTGEGLQRPDLSTGDGLYKSTDAGATWAHLGLRDAQQIAQIVVDPRDARRVFVAALGHPYGPNEERGVFRSTDGGHSFRRVLYRDENTGAFDLLLDPRKPRTLYAALWAGRQAPWEIDGSWELHARNGLHKSTDGGDTWTPLTRGLPGAEDGLGRIGLGLAPSRPSRLFAVVDARAGGGLYRSDDAGANWQRVNDDGRLWGRGSDFAEVKVDPRDPDVVYVANVVAWKSTDGGATFTAWRGAPGGDDYHRVWVHPERTNVILMAGDQGAIVTVNGGASWSSWYNQPTAQLYHVATDTRFPYNVYGGQQESGSVAIASRGAGGRITFRDWQPVGVEEYGYVAPDALDPDVVYGGKLTRFDRRTGQVQNVAPRALRGDGYRVVRTQPVLFSPADPHVLLFASNVLWKTTDGGRDWTQISPDLTRESAEVPANLGAFAPLDPQRGRHRGVIYTVAPSPLDVDLIWAGTDDGLIHVTRDGGRSWSNVTPPGLVPWAKVSLMDASPFERDGAYAAVNTFRLDDLRPHVWRTRDGGKTWAHVTQGLPDGGVVNVVRADPRRRGLLYAGTEQAVYVSFDDGEHWQPLRLNMPATSIRDLVVHGDDLVVATHGRSFWILDDVTPLRQIDARSADADALLFEPQTALRARFSTNTDTPLPPDEPGGENPPEGAIVDYWLKADARGPLTLEVLDAQGALVRRFTSEDVLEPARDEGNVPAYWVRAPRRLSAAAGAHRFVWDLHLAPPAGVSPGFPMAAVPADTPREPRGPWVLPGTYTLRLGVDGRTLTQPLRVEMDPRVPATADELKLQFDSSRELAVALAEAHAAVAEVRAARARLAARVAPVGARGDDALRALDAQLAELAGEGFARVGPDSLGRLASQLEQLYETVQGIDAAPTPQALAAIGERRAALAALLARWHTLRAQVPGAAPAALHGAALR